MNSNLKEFLDMSEFKKIVANSQINSECQLLVGGDFCGIQKYIYKIASKHAAKSLKGRSFYLHLLSDAIVRFLLKKLKLDKDAVIYNSGGSFYLMTPDTEWIRQTIGEVTLEIEKHLFDAHGTDLYLALDYVPLAKAYGNELRQAWTDLFNRRRVQKNKKFSRLIAAYPSLFFEPSMNGGEFKHDSVTGEELGKDAKSDGKNVYSPITYNQIEIGKALYRSDRLLITQSPVDQWGAITCVCPANLGFYYYFANREDIIELKNLANTVTFEEEAVKGSVLWLKTFEQLARNTDNQEDRFERIGVLRMDVDNLGLLFQQGIPAEAATLERYRNLSHKFDYFFGDYLHTLINPGKSVVIYSGGDDIFVVGAWDETIRLAKKIREEFRVYTKYNPIFSISGGIAIVEPKYPIMKGAEESEIEEKASKEHFISMQNGNPLEKNSLSFMDMPLNWDEEFPIVEQLKNDILSLLKNQLNMSFVHKVMKYAASAEFYNHRVKNFKIYWMLTYDLTRMLEDTKQVQCKSLIQSCINEVCKGGDHLGGRLLKSDYHPLELWQFACRWAELEYRTYKRTF